MRPAQVAQSLGIVRHQLGCTFFSLQRFVFAALRLQHGTQGFPRKTALGRQLDHGAGRRFTLHVVTLIEQAHQGILFLKRRFMLRCDHPKGFVAWGSDTLGQRIEHGKRQTLRLRNRQNLCGQGMLVIPNQAIHIAEPELRAPWVGVQRSLEIGQSLRGLKHLHGQQHAQIVIGVSVPWLYRQNLLIPGSRFFKLPGLVTLNGTLQQFIH